MVAATDIPPLPPPAAIPDFRAPPRSARIPVDEITARAREIRPGHALLTVIGGALFGVAWTVAKLFGAAWIVLTWAWSACEMGWAEARGKGPSKNRLLDENEQLRAAVRRLGGQA